MGLRTLSAMVNSEPFANLSIVSFASGLDGLSPLDTPYRQVINTAIARKEQHPRKVGAQLGRYE